MEPCFESLSYDIFGITWNSHLPFELNCGARLEAVTLQGTVEFVAANYPSIFGSSEADRRFLDEAQTPAKTRFLRMSDRFVFRDGARAVGLLVGHPLDWSTYYWRSVAILPDYQGRGLLAAAASQTDNVMRSSGITRLEAEVAPNNHRQLRLLSRLGYFVIGSMNSERWGSVLRLTKYLVPEAQERFVTQFCRNGSGASITPNQKRMP